MAAKLNMTQQEYSRLENKQEIEDELVVKIAEVLDFPEEIIRQVNSSPTFQTVYQQNGNTGNGFYYLHPTEKIVEMYERLLNEKDKIIQMQKEVIEMHQQHKQKP